MLQELYTYQKTTTLLPSPVLGIIKDGPIETRWKITSWTKPSICAKKKDLSTVAAKTMCVSVRTWPLKKTTTRREYNSVVRYQTAADSKAGSWLWWGSLYVLATRAATLACTFPLNPVQDIRGGLSQDGEGERDMSTLWRYRGCPEALCLTLPPPHKFYVH